MSSFIFLLFGYNKNVKNLLIFMEYLPRIFWNISVRRMDFMATLEIKDLHVSVKDEESKEEKEILKGVNLKMKTGEIYSFSNHHGSS